MVEGVGMVVGRRRGGGDPLMGMGRGVREGSGMLWRVGEKVIIWDGDSEWLILKVIEVKYGDGRNEGNGGGVTGMLRTGDKRDDAWWEGMGVDGAVVIGWGGGDKKIMGDVENGDAVDKKRRDNYTNNR